MSDETALQVTLLAFSMDATMVGLTYLTGLAPLRAHTRADDMIPQLIVSLLLLNVWDIPKVALTSQVQHFVVLILMVATDLDVTEVEVSAEFNDSATDV